LVDYRSCYLPFFHKFLVICDMLLQKFYIHNACGVSEIICTRWHANFSWMLACQLYLDISWHGLLSWFIAHLIELVLVNGKEFKTMQQPIWLYKHNTLLFFNPIMSCK
jgi:hypothetical protein